MEEFIGTIDNEKIREELYEAIQGRGAFRRFKDGIVEHDVDEQWHKYKESKIRELVVEWCKDNKAKVKLFQNYRV